MHQKSMEFDMQGHTLTRFCANVNKIARGPHLGNPKHHVRGLLLLLGCLLLKSMLFLGFWIESVSSVCINCVSHYFYELMFIFFIGICCRKVSYFVLTTSNMYMMELADSIKHLNFYAIGFSCVSPICKIANVCHGSDLNSGTQWALLETFFCIESEDIITLIFHVKFSMSLSFQTYS